MVVQPSWCAKVQEIAAIAPQRAPRYLALAEDWATGQGTDEFASMRAPCQKIK
jgi:hypothetical protein